MIKAYLHSIEQAIAALGKLALGANLYNEERESNVIVLRGSVQFVDGSQLHFREFVQLIEAQPPNRYKYAYHYQRADESLIFRYDNARHYPHLPTAPHHKHLGDDDVIAANPPDLSTILAEIQTLLGKG